MVDCRNFETLFTVEQLKGELSSSALGRELLSIFTLKNLTPVYQPIVDIKNQKVFGFEALTRGPENSPLHRPLHLFHAAEEFGCLQEMDWLARETAITKYHEFGNKEYLFINVTVNALMQNSNPQGMTLTCLQELGVDIEQVVIEITELQPVDDYEMFVRSINHYREMGFKVAIDDLGAGYNGLRLWSEVKPDFVKIDKHFVSDLDGDEDKKRFIETITALAKGLNTKIIAEGVEDEATLKILENFGVDYVQGYLLKKPQLEPTLDLDYHWDKSYLMSYEKNETVESLIQQSEAIKSSTTVGEATEFFLENSTVDFLPVVDDGKIQGVIWRKELMDLLARRFGRDLHQRKQVYKVMDSSPLVIEKNTPLVDLSRMITEYEGNHRGDIFLITEEGQYLGGGCFLDLLRVITDLKVKSAQYANPLSGLPGNVPIQKTISQYLDQNLEFMMVYVDVDNFKPYNDHYSFEQGDDIIRCVAQILHRNIKEGKDFIGHIGGDDFILISTRMTDYQQLCRDIIEEFNHIKAEFYSVEDVQQGGILGKDRDGNERLYPLLSLTLGVLLVSPGICEHPQMVTSYATKAKKQAKLLGGNQFFVIDSQNLNLA
ncbi:MAG: GGDEF domain-containing protein [Pseudomonadota bacterium]|nr:GGDEF domain-containing protein [Pseudomonadota bacterium]